MWALYVFSVIGAVALIAMLALGVNKAIDFFSEIGALKSKCDRIDDRSWDHERRIAAIHDNIISIHNDISMFSTRMDAAENTIRGMKKEDTENA